MNKEEFSKALSELNIILKFLPDKEREKIPSKLLKFFENNEDKNYEVKIDLNKSIEDQDLRESTKDLIAVVYKNYLCTLEERKNIDKILLENDKVYEGKLKEKYNTYDLFNNSNKKTTKIEEKNLTVKDENINIFKKILNVFRNVFYKNN